MSSNLAPAPIREYSDPSRSAIVIKSPVDRIMATVISDTPANEALPTIYDNLWDRVTAGFSLQGYYSHPAVIHEVARYQTSQMLFDRVAERASPYLFWIVEELERRELPLELALIPVVESGFNPTAYSQQDAAGLWQFIAATGNKYGLEQNWWYDGRRDPIASTIAALDYLEALYARFDQDWLLAFAAYNTGEGNVIRAIRKNQRNSQPTDFWSLPLATETKAHVPRILAIAKIVANTKEYGIDLASLPNDPYFDIVEVNSQIDLSLAARLADLELERLEQLNPAYLQWATHPDAQQTLLLPKNRVPAFTQKLAALPSQDRVTWDRYEIRSGDSLGAIARNLSTRVDILRTVNNLNGDQIIAGKSLLVPRTSSPDQLVAPAGWQQQTDTTTLIVPEHYQVKPGDSLWAIARKFDLKSGDIAQWNKLEPRSVLRPGQILALKSTTSNENNNLINSDRNFTYQVESGDSLAKIARQFNVTLDQILSWNDIDNDRRIYPGQLIRFITADSEIN